MAVVADTVVVELIARMDAYERNLRNASNQSDRAFNRIESGAAKAGAGLARSVRAMSTALATLGIAFGGQAVLQLTAAWTDLNSRVVNAVGSVDKASAVMDRLQQIARRTYSSLGQTSEAYLQNSQALTALGYSTQQQLDLAEALNNSLVISATRGDRARQVMDAWSKAMAEGSLRGDNLNTIIASGGRLSKALADSLGVSVNELRALGAQGKITTDAMYGVTGQLEQLREEADRMPATVTDGFTLLQNAIFAFVGQADEAVGSSEALAEAIVSISDAIANAPDTDLFDNIFRGLGNELARFIEEGGRELEYLSGILGALAKLKDSPADGLVALNGAMGGNIRTAETFELALADAEQALANFAVNTQGRFTTAIGETENGVVTLGDAVQDLIQQILAGGGSAEEAEEAILALGSVGDGEFTPLQNALSALVSQLFAVRDTAVLAREAAANIDSDLGQFPSKRLFNRTIGVDLTNDGGTPVRPTVTSTGAAKKTPDEKFNESLEAQKRRNDELQRETALRATLNPLVNDYGYALEKFRIQTDLENAATREGLELTPERVAAIAELAETYASAKVAAEQLDESQKQLKASAEAWADTLKDASRSFIDDLIEGKTAAEAFGNVLSNIGSKLIDLGLSNLFGSGGFNLGSLFGGGRGFPTRAMGGNVYAGQPTMINERGQEIFVPTQPGRMVPASQVGGGGSVTFAPQIDARGADVAAVARLEQSMQRLAQEIVPTIRREISQGPKKGRR